MTAVSRHSAIAAIYIVFNNVDICRPLGNKRQVSIDFIETKFPYFLLAAIIIVPSDKRIPCLCWIRRFNHLAAVRHSLAINGRTALRVKRHRVHFDPSGIKSYIALDWILIEIPRLICIL